MTPALIVTGRGHIGRARVVTGTSHLPASGSRAPGPPAGDMAQPCKPGSDIGEQIKKDFFLKKRKIKEDNRSWVEIKGN